MEKVIFAITGASGSLYAVEFLKIMAEEGIDVHGVISSAGEKVLHLETGLLKTDLPGISKWFEVDDFTAPIASGSSLYKGMVILPCTMGTLSAVAHGQSGNLIHRAADVTLKEKRSLVLAVRETPLNGIHLKNMVAADSAGAIIFPAMPAFYQKPDSLEEMARDFASRVAAFLGVDVSGMKRWQGVS